MKEMLKKRYRELQEYCHISTTEENEKIYSIIKSSVKDFMRQCKTPAIWCFGEHTKMLMADFMFELKGIHYVIDNGIEKTTSGGFEIIHDADIDQKGIDGILISSRVYRDEIKKRIENEFGSVFVLDIYDALEAEGIFLEVEYYVKSHPYNKYFNINRQQRMLSVETDVEKRRELLRKIVLLYIEIKDFRSASFYAEKLTELCNGEWERGLAEQLEQLYESELHAMEQIDGNNVLMLCIDGLRRKEAYSSHMERLYDFLRRETYFFTNAYSVSTTTFESLIPAYSENADLRTKYYESNVIPSDRCRFIQEAKKQGRKIFFYTDGCAYIDDEAVTVTDCAQTATEKVWDFLMDAAEEKNGLFYLHELYESHFSYSNPYTKSELVSQGTNIMFDYLEREGGGIRHDYCGQQKDALKYLDDVFVPLIERLPCRMVLFADHGNILFESGTRLEDIEFPMYTFHEDWIQIPLAVRAPEVETGVDDSLISIMEINNIVIGLLNQRRMSYEGRPVIKVVRSALYNPDFQYLYKKTGNEQGLLAFEVFIFAEGYKLAVYSNGVTELYDKMTDRLLLDEGLKEKLIDKVKCEITVCDRYNLNAGVKFSSDNRK